MIEYNDPSLLREGKTALSRNTEGSSDALNLRYAATDHDRSTRSLEKRVITPIRMHAITCDDILDAAFSMRS